MSIELTKDEVERLTLVVSAAIMNLPDSDRLLEGVLDKLLEALSTDDIAASAQQLWND